MNNGHDTATVGETPGSTPSGDATETQEQLSHEREIAERTVQVHCDYISADEPIHERFPAGTVLAVVKNWARETFVPNPPSDKAYYLNDDKTRHRFTSEEELRTLAMLGYERGAVHFRLNEEQASGA